MNEKWTSQVKLTHKSDSDKSKESWIEYRKYDTYAEVLDAAKREGNSPEPACVADNGCHLTHIDLTEDKFDTSSGWLNDENALKFNEDGAYLLSDVVVHAADNAGNVSEKKLSQLTDGGNEIIVIDGQNETDKKVTLQVCDVVKGKQEGCTEANTWHRNSAALKVTVNDKWFPVASRLATNRSMLAPQLGNPGEVSLGEFAAGQGNNWIMNVQLPTNGSGDGAGKTVEGRYVFDLTYRTIGGVPIQSPTLKFGVDYTPPKITKVNFALVNPSQWNWVFAPEPETVDISTSDDVSGVCNVNDDQCQDAGPTFHGVFSEHGTNNPPSKVDSRDAGNHTTEVSVNFGDDSERLTLKGSTLRISDRAGNVSSLDLGDTVMPSGYVPEKDKPKLLSNLPKGTTGIAIDTKAPTIGVVYDNNDVRNGKYYKAKRTATVTINESNFDFIKGNDKYRDIVVTRADGSKSTVDADKFDNPSKDGSTWVAQVPCDHDADWTFDVSLTDPAGHVAAPYHSEFTIDTQKPILEMKFDNNSSENGNYYKATRTASIKQTERNFSPADTAVTVSAKDANGTAVTPPAAAPWSAPSKDYERTTSVAFTGELHYSIKVTATDLAGNTAEAVEEPEFIIDMTKPKLAISQVTDKTAYAGKVTPQIDFSDTNFDPMFADYKLTRTRNPDPSKKDQNAKRGKSNANDVYLQSKEQDSSTSKSVALPDVEHTVDNDDVYTLDAKVKDKAGNESEQKVVFSLNRFGSNYILDGATQNILGRYIKVPQEVHVTEINVSGLNFDKSHTELVHNQSVKSISSAKDYHLVSDRTSGWQEDTYDFPASLFNADGYYRLRLTSVDAAGNLSQNTMNKKNEARNGDAQINFAVDQDMPSASVDELKNNSVVYAPSRALVVDAKDDVALKSAELKVDGRTVGHWEGKRTLSPMSYRLEADQHEHSVEVISTDMAGNRTKTEYSGIVVATSWWAYMMARGLLLPLIFGGIIVVALVAIGAVAAVRRSKSVAYRRNVFRHSKSK
ncbi:Ig-like domain repeat protein [Bifidobacterium sp. ESL0690]|uniref:Ig-like domain repeat protein n=1 Tax=Bifidobacterium sp. ESL0690 TaxID=2983214 RepID=UPI0023FA087C|nr:Ig-like domain repeat protein [Bifidobacterium sp. ESL0690]WEV46285.1 Ig-like domain repeat protein [Bifidobacterium sp. ESL0690]